MSESKINILQFGTGNFLRGFIEPMFQSLKDKGIWEPRIVLVQSTNSNSLKRLEETNFNYPLWLAGIQDGKEVNEEIKIDCINAGLKLLDQTEAFLKLAESEELEFVISNVTEAGFKLEEEEEISLFPKSFPARLTLFLFKRFEFFEGDSSKGLQIFPCELISNNGDKLLEMVRDQSEKWNLPQEFKAWINQYNSFYNTLVDRIIPGKPSEETLKEFRPELDLHPSRVQGEPYFFLGLEAKDKNVDKGILGDPDLNITFTQDLTPYSLRKVRILNGAHIAMVALGLPKGIRTVGDFMRDDSLFLHLREMIESEVIPVLPMDQDELKVYMEEIFDRFRNPFIEHKLRDISLNTIAKLSPRILDSVQDYYQKFNRLPEKLTEVFIQSIDSYLKYPESIRDTEKVKAIFDQAGQLKNPEEKADFLLDHPDLWNYELSSLAGVRKRLVASIS